MKLSGTVPLLGALLLYVPSPALASEQQVQYFPQLADGGGYSTTWYFTGYGLGPTSVDVEILDKDGYRLTLTTDQGTSDTFHLSLNGYGSTSLRTLGAGSTVKTGYVKITSSPPVGVTETIKLAGSNGLASRAAVLPSFPIVMATLLVPDARSTAIALLNPDFSNTIIFRLLDKDGNPAGPPSTFPMEAHRQVALYVNQIPGFEKVASLDGSIELSGSSPFYVTTLAFEGQNFAIAPVLPGRSEPADDRGSLLNQYNSLLQQSLNLGDQLLPPSAEDLASFAGFLSQPQTGLIRLLPRETYDGHLTIRGGGAYYSFARLTHEYGYGSDIGLEQGYLSVGFAGADFGFLASLGNMSIDGVTLDDPAVQYLASFAAPTNLSDARVQQQRAGAGFSIGSYRYIDRMNAAQNTYVLRSVCYGRSDLLVAFRVTRFDTDGSMILVWKLLRSFPVPQLQ